MKVMQIKCRVWSSHLLLTVSTFLLKQKGRSVLSLVLSYLTNHYRFRAHLVGCVSTMAILVAGFTDSLWKLNKCSFAVNLWGLGEQEAMVEQKDAYGCKSWDWLSDHRVSLGRITEGAMHLLAWETQGAWLTNSIATTRTISNITTT